MYGRIAEMALELEHRHSDGSWSRFERSHHDPADHDPERGWANAQVYRCTRCDEQIRVRSASDAPDEAIGGQ